MSAADHDVLDEYGVSVVCVGWYTPATWRELSAIPEAGIEMSYSAFVRKAERRIADYAAQGFRVEKVPIDIGQMRAWCHKHGYELDAKGRAAFGAVLAIAWRGRHGGAGRRPYAIGAVMTPAITLTRALSDDRLFGPTFVAPSFWTWKTVAKLIDGLPLTEKREIALYKKATCRDRLPKHRAIRRLILLAGRRAGKDRFFSAVAVWRAALCADWRKHQSAGEGAVVILIGADKKQARILRKYCAGLLAAPLLAKEIVRETEEVIEFRNGASLEIVVNDASLVRGRSAIAVIGSECCHWRTDEASASSDEEVVSAATRSMAMCPDGGLLLLGSSVHRKRGYMFKQFQKLHGNNRAESLCWFATSQEMNPRLPQRVIDAALAEDSVRARAEYLSIWREDSGDFVPMDVLEVITDWGITERPPRREFRYTAYYDAATGQGADSVALFICHAEASSGEDKVMHRMPLIVSDLVRERKPRFVLADVIAGWSELLRNYGISKIYSDKFAFGICSDLWARCGITNIKNETDTSDNYLRCLPTLTSRRARLLDVEIIRAQFAGLQGVFHSGHEFVEHGRAASAHDDVATAIAGGLVQASKLSKHPSPERIRAHLERALTYPFGSGGSFAPAHWPRLTPEQRYGERAWALMTRGRGY